MSRGEYIAREALSYRGAPYRFGGTSRRGIDCSALVQAAYRQWGLMLPRTSVEQFRRGVAVHQNELRAGDVLFFKNTYKRGISHVGIYVGEGKFVHAAGRRQGVIVSSLASAHYQKHLAGARRLALDKEPVHAQPQQSDLPPAPEDEAPEPQR